MLVEAGERKSVHPGLAGLVPSLWFYQGVGYFEGRRLQVCLWSL